MMSSLFSAVAGLKAHQTRMDVIGNNVANVNTVGFKSSRVNFQEALSQALRGASAPTGTSTDGWGGTNPIQVGLGVNVASMDSSQTNGTLQPTSRLTDAAIDGEGFFVVQAGNKVAYTRVGAFGTDGDGVLVDSQGRKVLGWGPNQDITTKPLPIRIAFDSTMPAQATDLIQFTKNLDCESETGTTKSIPVSVFDSQGKAHSISVIFEKAADKNQWTWSLNGATGGGTIEFNEQGLLESGYTAQIDIPDVGGSVTLDLGGVTQYAGPTTVDMSYVSGCTFGTFESYTFDTTGTISGFYSNGETKVIARLALARFNNPGGLQRAGNSLYEESNNSGKARLDLAGANGYGTIAPSSLEMSNVDLAEEFTQMIITQRGFQANSRVITVSDELLQELVNIKR